MNICTYIPLRQPFDIAGINNRLSLAYKEICYLKAGSLPRPFGADGDVLTIVSGSPSWQPASGGTPSLTATQIAFGDGSNLMTSSSNLNYTGSAFNVIDADVTLTNANTGFYTIVASGISKMGDIGASASNIFTVDDNNSLAYYDNTAHTGKFGINTSSPSVAFDVLGDSKFTVSDFTIQDAFSNQIAVFNPLAVQIGDISGAGNSNALRIDDINDNMNFSNGTATGKFGINTSTPSVALDVFGNVKAFSNAGDGLFTGSAVSKVGDWNNAVGGNILAVDDANNLAYYDNTAHTGLFGINTSTPSVALDVVGDIKLSSTGTYTNGLIKTETTGGNAIVYLGDYTALGNGTGILIDDVNQVMNFTNTAGVVGAFTFNTGSVQMNAYGAGAATFDASGNITSVSDERLKTNIKPYKTGLKELLLINPIQYNWNEKSKMETKGTYAGFSAQNVKANIPFGTGENKDGYLSLQDRALLATAFNAIQELSAKVDKLEKQNKQLLDKIEKNNKI